MPRGIPVSEVEMSRFRRIAAVVAVVLVGPIGGLALSATAAQAKTCQTANGPYDVAAPPAVLGTGADPAEVAAANCTLGFDEQIIYPLSVIALCLLATAVTLVLVRRETAYDVIGSEA